MDSFYGGRRGISFELVKTYSSKNAMLLDFASSNCSVAFGQYVSIDSTDADRGSIYRRTENLANGNNGAVFAGKVTGLNGINSKIDIIPYSESDESATLKNLSIENDLIPGNEIVDNIPYKVKTSYNETENVYNTEYGIQLPYNVIDFNTGYSDNGNFEIVANEKRPFYQNYTLKIPAILNGNSVKEIAFITSSTYSQYAPIYISPSNRTEIPEEEFTDILAYKLSEHRLVNHFNIKLNVTGNPAEQGLYELSGTNFILTEDTIVINGKTYYEKIIEDISADSWYKLCDFAQIDISYEEDKDCIVLLDKNAQVTEVPLKNIDRLNLSEDGILTAYYKDGNATPSFVIVDNSTIVNPKKEKLYERENDVYVLTTDTVVDSTKTYYKKIYETSQILNQDNPLTWIKDIVLSDDENNILITYNTGVQQVFPSIINGVKSINYDENGVMTVQYTRPQVVHNYTKIENIPSGANPAENNWYEISPVYYAEILQKITDGVIKNVEEYNTAIQELQEELSDAIDLYTLTEDETLTIYTYDTNSWNKTYFIKGEDTYTGNIQTIGTIRSIESIDYVEETDEIVITYNTVDNNQQKERVAFKAFLRGIESIVYDETTDQVVVTYTDNTEDILPFNLRITGIKFNDSGQLVFTFNNGKQMTTSKSISYPETIQFNDLTKKLEMVFNTSFKFTLVENPEGNPQELGYYVYNSETDEYILTTDTAVVADKNYYIRYFSPSSAIPISPALNYIQRLEIDPNDYRLLVYFSDPEKRGTIEYDGITGWKNLGVVKDNSGIFIDLNITSTVYEPEYSTVGRTIETLNERYPDGYRNNPHSCVAVGSQSGSKIIYGYNADESTWYLLGRFSTETGVAANSIEDYNAGIAYDVEALPPGGLWFVVQERILEDYNEALQYYGTNWEEF